MPGREEERGAEITLSPGAGESTGYLELPAPSSGSARGLAKALLIVLLGIAAAASMALAFLLPGLLSKEESGLDEGGLSAGESTVSFDLRYDLDLEGEDSLVEFTIALPATLDRRQEVLAMDFDPQPAEVFDREGNSYARFVFREPREDLTVSIEGRVLLLGYDLEAARERESSGEEGDLDAFLAGETYLEKDDFGVREAAREIEGDTDVEIVEGIFDFVLSNMSYSEYDPGDVGAAEALRREEGDCTEYSDLMVAMCRARGIPAKYVDGYYVEGCGDLYGHNWVEVYLEDYGWVPFDPTFADSGSATFSRLDPVTLRVSHLRNDETLGCYHFWYFYYEGDPIEVTETLVFTLD